MKTHSLARFSQWLLLVREALDLIKFDKAGQVFEYIAASFVAQALTRIHKSHHRNTVTIRRGQNWVSRAWLACAIAYFQFPSFWEFHISMACMMPSTAAQVAIFIFIIVYLQRQFMHIEVVLRLNIGIRLAIGLLPCEKWQSIINTETSFPSVLLRLESCSVLLVRRSHMLRRNNQVFDWHLLLHDLFVMLHLRIGGIFVV